MKMTVLYKEINQKMEHEPMEDVNEDMRESSDIMEEENNEIFEDAEGQENESQPKVYLPGKPLTSEEELVVDKTAYRMLHHAQSGAPCLSFDIIPDNLGDTREDYPLSMYLVAGTQAARAHVNNLLVMKMTNLYSTNNESEDESSDESDAESCQNVSVMTVAPIKHQGCVNRVRTTKIGHSTFAASWSELGRVHIWNLDEQLKIVDNEELLPAYRERCAKSDDAAKPLVTFKGHLLEGYGLDWCPMEKGTLASGDCEGSIHLWRMDYGSGSPIWHVDQRTYKSHASLSVEDLQWSPNEKEVLASCSVDRSIRIWDTRANPQSACVLAVPEAHSMDVNVISWNRKETQFLVSGGDDGFIRVWDLRQFGSNHPSALATFKQHTAPITTVEWHPEEATVFASGGSDDQIVQWDLSVEVDQSEEIQDNELKELPPQLLFIHQGQTDIKELHWHPQCPGVLVSTAHSGFNIFRTISV